MTTSGTVGLTTLDTSKVIEHAFRRCKVHPSQQTPETIEIAKQNLYILLTNLSNLGLNLWVVEKQYVGCAAGQQVYVCPTGTIDLLNLTYSQPSRTTGTNTVAATSIVTELTSATSVVRLGVKFSAITASSTLTFSSSADGVTYTTISTETKTDWATDTWYWFDVDPAVSNVFFKASVGTAVTFSEFYLATSVYDVPCTAWNRDTWAAMTSKTQQGKPVTSYFFEKLINPQITAWPVPNNDYDYFTMFVHRQIQDVGTLTQTLEIPSRWYEAVIWQLALRLAFELPTSLVPLEVTQLVEKMSEKYTFEVGEEESDGMPFYLVPTIRAYTS